MFSRDITTDNYTHFSVRV